MNKNFLNEASAVIKENIGLETAVMYQDFFENKGLADPKQIFNIYENLLLEFLGPKAAREPIQKIKNILAKKI